MNTHRWPAGVKLSLVYPNNCISKKTLEWVRRILIVSAPDTDAVGSEMLILMNHGQPDLAHGHGETNEERSTNWSFAGR